jgi:hypothetical protein
MDVLMPVVTRVCSNTDSNHPGLVEPIYKLFLMILDGDYTMAAVHAKTGVPITILYSWRGQVGVDPERRPSAEHFALGHRARPDDIEDQIAQFIRCQFNVLSRSLNRPPLRSAVYMILHSFVAEK